MNVTVFFVILDEDELDLRGSQGLPQGSEVINPFLPTVLDSTKQLHYLADTGIGGIGHRSMILKRC